MKPQSQRIAVLLLLCAAASAQAETYTIQFGEAGGLLLRYEVFTTQKPSILPGGMGMLQNGVSGTLTNMARLPIYCLGLRAIALGGHELYPDIFSIFLRAGESERFQ